MGTINLESQVISILIPIFYFIYLFGITIQYIAFTTKTPENETPCYAPFKLVSDVLIVAGALWLGSNPCFFFIFFLTVFIFGVIYNLDSVLCSKIYLCFQFVVGIIWVRSHTICAFVICVIYFVIRVVRDKIKTGDPPTRRACARAAPYDDDNSVDVVSRLKSWRPLVGQNVNLGNGRQTIRRVKIINIYFRVNFSSSRRTCTVII
ncbi:hypothetical protein RND81_14G244300 [Saponaria officinalis]|uniref:Uncharacterized protein n=1 Tax=Saponaria officinalis TaxID=3572 RepID=A0AAW1GTD2_SAPOF